MSQKNKGSLTVRGKRKQHWEAYRSYKKATLKALRRGRWDYINNILQLGLEEGSSRPFWRYVKAQKQDSAGVAALKDQGKLFTDSSTKAEILNRQFKSVFTKDNEDHRNSGIAYTVHITLPLIDCLFLSRVLRNYYLKSNHLKLRAQMPFPAGY